LDRSLFVRRNTEITEPPLVPEIRLHLATEISPIWQATEESLAQGGVPPPFWAFAWPGGQALARYLLDRPEQVAGRSVLDFGAGSGLVAIAAAKAGASRVLAAEIDQFAAAAIPMNAALNGVTVEVAMGDFIDSANHGWEIITAGDVCYELPMADQVTQWLRDQARRRCLVLLGDPGRAYLPAGGLLERARYVVPTSRDLEDRETREAVVFEVIAGGAPERETRGDVGGASSIPKGVPQ
jgi:predicted nicotinamide N-methyase